MISPLVASSISQPSRSIVASGSLVGTRYVESSSGEKSLGESFERCVHRRRSYVSNR